MTATAHQKHIITKLCRALGIREPIEEQAMSCYEAYMTIQWLSAQLAVRRKGGDRDVPTSCNRST